MLKKLISAYVLIAIGTVVLIALLGASAMDCPHTDGYTTWQASCMPLSDGGVHLWIGIMIVFVVVGVIYVIRSRRGYDKT